MNEHQERTIPIETYPKNARILCVCDHGNSRSKYMARALSSLGYQQARILGIQDSSSAQDKITQIRGHEIILCASDTVKSSLEKFLAQHLEQRPSTLLNIEINERLHAKLYYFLRGPKGNSNIELREIVTQLSELGFK